MNKNNLGMSNSSYNLSHHELGETAVYFRDAAKGIGLRKTLSFKFNMKILFNNRSKFDDIRKSSIRHDCGKATRARTCCLHSRISQKSTGYAEMHGQ